MCPFRNLKRFVDINAPKEKWLWFENSLSVIWRFTRSIPIKCINPSNASIPNLSVFFIHGYFLDSLKLPIRCKRAIFSFVSVFLQSTNFYMISLWKYKWKVSLMLTILFALEFGARQLILPEMVSHFCCLSVANGCSELHQSFAVFLYFFRPR